MSCEGDTQAKFLILSDVHGPRDKWRNERGGTAARGDSLHLDFCQRADMGPAAMESWFQGISLEFALPLAPIVFSDYPSAHADHEVAASGLDRLAPLGKILWYEKDSSPPD